MIFKYFKNKIIWSDYCKLNHMFKPLLSKLNFLNGISLYKIPLHYKSKTKWTKIKFCLYKYTYYVVTLAIKHLFLFASSFLKLISLDFWQKSWSNPYSFTVFDTVKAFFSRHFVWIKYVRFLYPKAYIDNMKLQHHFLV